MLQVREVTYRIERTAPHCYSVVRLLDDTEVGTFRTRPQLRISSAQIEVGLLRDIVRAALRSARTSAVMHAAPVCQPEADEHSASSTSPSAAGAMTPVTDSTAASALPSSAASSNPPPVRPPSSAPPPASAMA